MSTPSLLSISKQATHKVCIHFCIYFLKFTSVCAYILRALDVLFYGKFKYGFTIIIFRATTVYQAGVRLFWDVGSCGIHAMWLERYNSKAGILTSDKHKYNLGVKKMNWMIHISEEGPILASYDIRIPVLLMALNSVIGRPIKVNIAKGQEW
eukprot:514284_1